jgi:hypothetical protein
VAEDDDDDRSRRLVRDNAVKAVVRLDDGLSNRKIAEDKTRRRGVHIMVGCVQKRRCEDVVEQWLIFVLNRRSGKPPIYL